MRPVWYRLVREVQRRRLATVVLTAIVATVLGAVLTIDAGAERTSTAPDRYTSAHGQPFDGVIYQPRGRPRTSEVAQLPGARRVVGATFVFGAVVRPGTTDDLGSFVFAGSYEGIGAHLVSGRDAATATEFVATNSFVKVNHVAIGDRFDVVTLTQASADRAGFTANEPDGPRIEAVLVGVVDGPAEADDPTSVSSPNAIFPSGLLDGTDIGVATTIIAVALQPGVDLNGFRAELDGLPDGDAFSLEPVVVVGPTVRNATRAQARGLWLLAGASAIAAVAVLGQILTRSVRASSAERERLMAIGFTRTQVVVASLGTAIVPVVAGSGLAIGLAWAVSGVFPTGVVRRMEPSTGLRFEPWVLVGGAAILAIAIVTWCVIALSVAGRHRHARSPVLDRVAPRVGSATAATGLRFAYARGARDAGSPRASTVGLLALVIGIVGALTFAYSLDRLIGDPKRYGDNYDLRFGSGETSVSQELQDKLDADPDVSALMLLAESQARVGDATLRLVGMQPIRGEVAPHVLEGRLPAAEDEIALGRLAARSLHVHVGDALDLTGSDVARTFRVTGLVVVPSIGLNNGVGQDGVLTMAALRRLEPDATANTAVANLRDGAPSGTAERIMSDYQGADPGPSERPASISSLVRVRGIPFVLAALLGALAVLTIVHVLLVSVRNRRRDAAVLRCLGADAWWITRTVHWQATIFALVPLLIGVPLGLLAGDIVFQAFANSVGAVNDASFPFVVMAVAVVAFVAVANAATTVPAAHARRQAPARLLQGE